MLARHRQLFATAVFFMDAMIIAIAWVAAYVLRFHLLGLPAPLGIPPLSTYLWLDAVLTPFALLVLRSFRIYRSARTARLGQEIYALVQGMAIVTALAALASFFSRGELSRSVLLLFAVLSTTVMMTARL